MNSVYKRDGCPLSGLDSLAVAYSSGPTLCRDTKIPEESGNFSVDTLASTILPCPKFLDNNHEENSPLSASISHNI